MAAGCGRARAQRVRIGGRRRAHGIRHARVAIGLGRIEELALRCAADAVETLRGSVGLPGDRRARALRRSPYLTLFPASLEDPGEPGQPRTARFHDPAWDAPAAELPTGGPAPTRRWST